MKLHTLDHVYSQLLALCHPEAKLSIVLLHLTHLMLSTITPLYEFDLSVSLHVTSPLAYITYKP